MGRKTKPTLSLAQLEKMLGEGRIIPGREKVVVELRDMVRFMQQMQMGDGRGRAGNGNDEGFRGNREKVSGRK